MIPADRPQCAYVLCADAVVVICAVDGCEWSQVEANRHRAEAAGRGHRMEHRAALFSDGSGQMTVYDALGAVS